VKRPFVRAVVFATALLGASLAGSGAASAAPAPLPCLPKDTAMFKTAAKTCEVALGPSGLPYRTPSLIEGERGQLRVYAHYLAGTSARGRSDAVPPIALKDVERALSAKGSAFQREAAFVAGRCQGATPETDARLTKLLLDLTDGARPSPTVTEAAMALVLRGERDRGVAALKQALLGGAGSEAWRAAGYLAQLGDLSGWGTLEALAHDAAPDTRLGALEAALSFVGLPQGPNVPALVAGALKDPDVGVRRAAPRLLVAAGHPEAPALLRALAADDPSEEVRLFANHALKQLE